MATTAEHNHAVSTIEQLTRMLKDTAESAMGQGVDPMALVKAGLDGWGKTWDSLSMVQRMMITNAIQTSRRVERWGNIRETV